MECKICLLRESERHNKLIPSPCKCKGSMGYVHKECLLQWGNMHDTDICPDCKYEITYLYFIPGYLVTHITKPIDRVWGFINKLKQSQNVP